jgi:hypothetical protein
MEITFLYQHVVLIEVLVQLRKHKVKWLAVSPSTPTDPPERERDRGVHSKWRNKCHKESEVSAKPPLDEFNFLLRYQNKVGQKNTSLIIFFTRK